MRVKIWVRTIQENQRELVLDLIDPKFDSEGMNAIPGSAGKRKEAESRESALPPKKKERQAER